MAYKNIYVDKKKEIVHVWDDVKGKAVFPLSTFQYAYKKKKGGAYKSIYGDSLEKIKSTNAYDSSLFESDVPIETRVLIDLYEDSDDPSIGHNVVTFDIETSVEGGFPNLETADKEITAIALHDTISNKYQVLILDKEGRLQNIENAEATIFAFKTEESLLLSFLDIWTELSPTVVTGWNTSGFDFPYLYRRLKRVLSDTHATRLSPIGECFFNKRMEKLVVGGISCLDYMVLYKKFVVTGEPSYSLAAIGKKVVKMDKIQYKGDLNNLYKEDINKYVEYNLNDVKIVVAIDKKLQFIELARGICHTGHVPYENFEMSSRFIEGTLLVYLRRLKLVAPNKPMREKENEDDDDMATSSDEDTFEGAYVKNPVPGRYEWVYDLDLTSMYPNIIISLNISPETKIAKIESVDVSDDAIDSRKMELGIEYDNLSNKEFKSKTSKSEYVCKKLHSFDSVLFSKKKIKSYTISGEKYSHDDVYSLIKNENLCISSYGVLYKLPTNDSYGIIPSVLIDWFENRKKMRKMAKECADKKEWDKYEFYDQRQRIYKILLNSIYGNLGMSGFRFYDIDNAQSTTLTGQTIIKNASKVVNLYYKTIVGDRYKITYEDGREEIISEEQYITYHK